MENFIEDSNEIEQIFMKTKSLQSFPKFFVCLETLWLNLKTFSYWFDLQVWVEGSAKTNVSDSLKRWNKVYFSQHKNLFIQDLDFHAFHFFIHSPMMKLFTRV
jgi:hypothetical protein